MNTRERRAKRTVWTPEMVKYLREHYPVEATNKVARELGVTLDAVRFKVHKLGVVKAGREPVWTPERDEYLREHYPTESAGKIAEQLGMTPAAVYARAHLLGISKKNPQNAQTWTEEMKAYLREHYPTDTVKEVAKHLDRSVGAVKYMASRMGLKKAKPAEPAPKTAEPKPVRFGDPKRMGENRNEVCEVTWTLVCSCALDGYTPEQIATMTERTVEQVEAVLRVCKENGYLDWIKRNRVASLNVRYDNSAGRFCLDVSE